MTNLMNLTDIIAWVGPLDYKVQELFDFDLPSVQLARRRKVFLDKFCV